MTTKSGQIAHLDRDSNNASEDKLAFLCLHHHDEYDSPSSQRKGFTIGEVKSFRKELYDANSRIETSGPSTADMTNVAQGGHGGGGEIFGNGTVVGGRGGRVGAGGRGRGGNGGSGFVRGDGLVIGGDGGSVDGTDVWYPPARSGWEHMLIQQGETPDWGMTYPGQGGMSPGYLWRHQIVDRIRTKYFTEKQTPEKIKRSKIDDVPLDYINSELRSSGFHWQAAQEEFWYIYFISNPENQ